MISVVICRNLVESEWEIDTWLMSCRVLGRKVEHMVLRELLAHASSKRIQQLRGVYIPTERNKLVEDHYSRLGFTLNSRADNGSSVWSIEVAGADVAAAPMLVRRIGLELPSSLMQNSSGIQRAK